MLTRYEALCSLWTPMHVKESPLSRHYLDSVSQFHRAMGVPRYAGLDRHQQMALISLRATLINEESREVFSALNRYDSTGTPEALQELAKELGDLLYVATGTAEVLSVPLVDPVVVRPSPPFFSGGNLFMAAGRAMGSLDSLVRLIDRHGSRESRRDEIDGIASDLQQLVLQVTHLAFSYNLPLRAVFDAIHVSNLTKLDPMTGHPLMRQDGKLLKTPWYKAPDLSFVAAAAA